MAKVKMQKGSAEWNTFVDFWNLCQEHWQPEGEEVYWDALMADCNKFVEKHPGPFARKIALAFMESLDERLREEKEEEEKTVNGLSFCS